MSCPLDVVFGDFNINYFVDTEFEPLKLSMESAGFNQVVCCPTFISGSLLDHVYLKATRISADIIEHTIINVYYSDHELSNWLSI